MAQPGPPVPGSFSFEVGTVFGVVIRGKTLIEQTERNSVASVACVYVGNGSADDVSESVRVSFRSDPTP